MCLSTRAISLDILPNQSVYQFQLAYRRFISKYGPPEVIYFDSASTFISFKRSLKDYSPIWNFRIPHAAWRGGHYERFVALIKFHLRRTLSHGIVPKTFSIEETRTTSEIENIINSRPISFDSSSAQEDRPLRPIDFIRPLGQSNLPLSLNNTFPTKIKSTSQTLNEMWKTLNFLKNKFWNTWKLEYITSLRERHHKLSQNTNRNPTVGEMILLFD